MIDPHILRAIERLRAEGIKVWANGEKLRLTIPEGKSLSDADRALLSANKSEVLTFLRGEAWQDDLTQTARINTAVFKASAVYASVFYPSGRCKCDDCATAREEKIGIERRPYRVAIEEICTKMRAAHKDRDAETVDTLIGELQHAIQPLAQHGPTTAEHLCS
jgi:hypothetical protein